MELPNLNPLPKWKDHHKILDKSESWKWKEELQAAEALYNQQREVFGLVIAFAENLPDEENERLSAKALIYENAFIIASKIISASGDTLYQIKMENASLIRFNCRQMWEQIAVAVMLGIADKIHKEVIEDSLKRFKELFRSWVTLFKKDEIEDEWGLFEQLFFIYYQPSMIKFYIITLTCMDK